MVKIDNEPKTPDISLEEAKRFITNDLMPGSFAILAKYFRSKSLNIQSKGYVDIVTQADIENENFLKNQLTNKYPQVHVLGEETGYSGEGSEELMWILDPLDGTVNFSRGQENFAVSIALVKRGVTKLGVVGIPRKNSIYWAQDDKEGVFESSGEQLRTSDVTSLNTASFRCDWVYDAKTRMKLAKLMENVAPQVRQILTGGSAVADILDVASGRVDVYFNPGLKPWDIAAACYMVEKAGGKVTTTSGKEWNAFEPDLIVSNGKTHDEFLQIVQETKLFNS